MGFQTITRSIQRKRLGHVDVNEEDEWKFRSVFFIVTGDVMSLSQDKIKRHQSRECRQRSQRPIDLCLRSLWWREKARRRVWKGSFQDLQWMELRLTHVTWIDTSTRVTRVRFWKTMRGMKSRHVMEQALVQFVGSTGDETVKED